MKLSLKGKDAESIGKVITKLMELDEGNYFVRVEKVRNIRSLNAERYYRGVVLKIIADHIGEDPNYLHDVFKYMFGAKRTINLKGKGIEVPYSNSDLDSKQFSQYVNDIKLWAMHWLEVHIPNADGLTNEQYLEISERKYY